MTNCAIIYGSLFPFIFSFSDGLTERWDILYNSFSPFTSLGDILGNIILFIPFGYFGIACLTTSRPDKSPYAKVVISGFFLALIIQLIQVYIPSRSPAIADVYWNMAGIVMGLGLIKLIEKYFPEFSIAGKDNIPLVLSLVWLLYLFFPFVPTLDFQEIKNSLKPLFLNPTFQGDIFILGLTGWLFFARFTKGFFQHKLLDKYRLPVFAILSLPARLFILENNIDFSSAMAVFAAILIWPLLANIPLSTKKIITGFIAVTIVLNGLWSLDFTWYDLNFSWMPFSGFLEGSLFHNTRTLFLKIFLYASLIFLIKSGWPHLRLRGFMVFSLVFMIEIIQIFMTSHTAEITDPLIVLFLSFMMFNKKNTSWFPKQNISKNPELGKIKSTPVFRKKIYLLSGSIALISIFISLIIKLPGVPYNVKELFRLDGMFIAIIPFGLFIVWFGMSIRLISHRMLDKPSRHFIHFPLLVLAAGLISYFLLKISVTEETLQDITGSPTIYKNVTFQNGWGDFGYMLSLYFPFPSIWNLIEQIIRFLALFSPVTFMLCIFYYSSDLIKKYDIHNFFNQSYLVSISMSFNILYALPWLFLCKYIAFDQANTDNLNELIARDGFFGTGGGGYLYLLVFLLTLNSVWVSQSIRHWIFKLLSVIIAGIAGWFLFNLGLEGNIEKYGLTFSGVDFLLGPDRRIKLSETMLFLRWIILYTGSITILAWGMKFDISSLLTTRSRMNKTAG